MYRVILEIRECLLSPDTRWTYFQKPFVLEDALGYELPVPAEYRIDIVHAIIRERFKDRPGSLAVKAGNYELYKAEDSNQTIEDGTALPPGSRIIMGIIIVSTQSTAETCPRLGCGSNKIMLTPNGSKRW